jgi:type IV pilus assembly protein PilM
MAKQQAVWGIDLGQSALKALRCKSHEEANRITAEAFDFIEYPKVLTAPDADPVELVREALKTFLSRNVVKGDRVAISVPGQAGLARFIKLPPVESKKIPDIVKYEAKQQIPFPLEDVIWDYQQMAGGSVEEGFALETEVGLFAMKRDQVYKALKPFEDVGIEVDIVQLTPLALYNFAAFDQMHHLPPPEEYDPDNPPDSLVLMSMGCDTTDLVVTNGYRVWQRSIPVGGNHFTKALVKELDLPFAKAEHLKRNATQAADPKAVFQAMRPVFHDLATECERSLNFFANLDRNAKISKIIGLGGVMKLPGIRTYLEQNLGYTVERVEEYARLSGVAVTESPVFKEHMLSFGACYGLCLQGLRPTRIRTNLIPAEVVHERMIRAKKPWAVAAAASLLLGLSISGVGDHWRAWNTVHEKWYKSAEDASTAAVNVAKSKQTEFQTQVDKVIELRDLGYKVVQNAEEREQWLQLLKAVNVCLPPYMSMPQVTVKDEWTDEERITNYHQINITAIESEKVDDVGLWWTMVKKIQSGALPMGAANPGGMPGFPGAGPPAEAPPAPDPAAPADPAAAGATPAPTGKGWIVRLTGHHYHNDPKIRATSGVEYLKNTLLAKLEQPYVDYLEDGQRKQQKVGKLGILHPSVIEAKRIITWDPSTSDRYNPFKVGPGAVNTGGGLYPGEGPGHRPPSPGGIAPPRPTTPGFPGEGPGGGTKKGPEAAVTKVIKANRLDFQIEFIWKPKSRTDQVLDDLKELEERKKAAEAAAAAGLPGAIPPAGQPAGQPTGTPPAGVPPRPDQTKTAPTGPLVPTGASTGAPGRAVAGREGVR